MTRSARPRSCCRRVDTDLAEVRAMLGDEGLIPG